MTDDIKQKIMKLHMRALIGKFSSEHIPAAVKNFKLRHEMMRMENALDELLITAETEIANQ